ncbi:MAG: hypothetical protein HY074_01715, partial [Deltaproteobacteria bacterium]|nr:hypothetical protein [Deltaproteobacteria bacterium]
MTSALKMSFVIVFACIIVPATARAGGFIEEYGKALNSYFDSVFRAKSESGTQATKQAYSEQFKEAHKVHDAERRAALDEAKTQLDGIRSDLANAAAGKLSTSAASARKGKPASTPAPT